MAGVRLHALLRHWALNYTNASALCGCSVHHIAFTHSIVQTIVDSRCDQFLTDSYVDQNYDFSRCRHRGGSTYQIVDSVVCSPTRSCRYQIRYQIFQKISTAHAVAKDSLF